MPLSIKWIALGLVGLTSASPSSSVLRACEELHQKLPDFTIFPNSTDYATEITRFWDKRCNLTPACVVRAQNADDISELLKTVKRNDAQFAIRGGGHMNYPGSNNIDDGVLLTLDAVNHTTLSDDKKSINVGPGARWVDVYSALAPDGLYAIGGRLKSIGVPGLSLLGGVSYFFNKYGFTADNIVSYDVVLANGEQVTASCEEHSELFWALKGSACNYGVVVNFEMRTLEIPEVSCTLQVFDEPAIEQYIKAAVDLVTYESGEVGGGGVFNVNYNATAKRMNAQVIGMEETTVSPPPRFENFTEIADNYTLSRTFRVSKPVEWHSQFETPNQMFRITFGHHTILADYDQIVFMYRAWKEAIPEIEDVEGLGATFVLNLVPRSAAAVGQTNGIGNTLGLDDSEPTIWWQFATSWARAEDDERVETWNRELLERLHNFNNDKGLGREILYGGDASEFQDPLSTYPKENIARMRQIREHYDPDLVWTKLNWGGFKLGG